MPVSPRPRKLVTSTFILLDRLRRVPNESICKLFNRTDDIGDAHVALLVQPDDQLRTSDEPDIKVLLRTRRVKAAIIRV
jgi:hypothetical protein